MFPSALLWFPLSGRKVSQTMKKGTIAIFALAALLCLLSGVSAKADTITLTWTQQDGPTGQPLPYILDSGTDLFTIPTGQVIVGAIFTSALGNPNAFLDSTAVMNVDVNGVQVGSCPNTSSPCWIGTGSPIPFTYTYTATDLLSLATGMADLTITQTGCCAIRLSPSTLTITTAPITATPEPGSLALLGLGVLGLAALKLGKR